MNRNKREHYERGRIMEKKMYVFIEIAYIVIFIVVIQKKNCID